MRSEYTESVPSVVLSHGGVQYSYQMALALQRAGLLSAFYTTIYDFRRLGKFLPWFRSRLSRRRYEGLDEALIKSNPCAELLQRAVSYLALGNSFFTNRSIHWRCRLFDDYISRELERIKFDLLIGLSGSALSSIKKTKEKGKISVVDQHDIHYSLAERLLREEQELHPEFASSIPYLPPLWSYLNCVKHELDLADFILVPSSFSLKSHLDGGIPQEKLILMLHGMNPPHDNVCPSKREGGKFRILFVGTLTQRKGLKYLLEAVKQLHSSQIELILIGDCMAEERALAPYRDFFRYIPYVPYSKLKDHFDHAHLLVLPSIFDAFGLVALDAMAAGLTVIVSEHTAAGSDIVRNGIDGFVVPIRDPEAIKREILTLYENENLRRQMGFNASERAKEFSWDTYAERLKNAIERILSTSRKPTYAA